MRLSILLGALTLVVCVSASNGATFDQEKNYEEPQSFCQGCRSIVSFMSTFNSTTRRQANKDLFRKFCELYYPVSTDYQLGPCPVFTEGLFSVLERVNPATHCDDIGACGPINYQLMTNYDLKVTDSPFCNLCTDIVVQVKAQLEDPRIIDDIHSKVDAFCEYLTVIEADKQCRAALQSYIDQALNFIKQLKPKDFCKSIQFCGPTEPIVSSRTKPVKNQKKLPTLADFNDFGIETSVQIGGQQVKNVDETSSINRVGMMTPNCMFCKAFVKEMFKFLKENKTEANIRNALDRGCDYIYQDKDKRDHCEDLVKAYTKELLELLADETNPEVICMFLEQCSYQTMPQTPVRKVETSAFESARSLLDRVFQQSSPSREPEPISMSKFLTMLDPTIEVNSMVTCVECKLFIRYLQDTVQEPSSQKEIRDWLLKNLCARIDDQDLASSCTNFVNQESAVFFKAVAESLNPETSCEQLGACNGGIRNNYLTKLKHQLNNYHELVPKKPAASPICDQCVQIVTKLDDYLSNHPIDHDISVLKDKVCNTIQDSNLRDSCVMIIQTFGQEIIQAISNMDNPNQLCQKISLC